MNKKIFSIPLLRFLVIATLIIPLAVGAIPPVNAQTISTEVIGWGYNYYGQIDPPDDLSDVVAIAAGAYHSLALKSDGTVVAWGYNNYGQATVPAGLTGVTAIAAGVWYSLALKSDGTVVAWGDNSRGQLDIPPGLSEVDAIFTGGFHNLALKNDGTAIGWGDNTYFQATIPSGLTDIQAFAAGYNYTLALKTDGTVVGWGYGSWGEQTVPAGLSGVIKIASGRYHNLALKSDGTVVAWGFNGYGQSTVPPDLTGVVAIAAGNNHSMALKGDGTVVTWGSNEQGNLVIPAGVDNVFAIAAGAFHSLALVPADEQANTAPIAIPGGPYLGAINTSISFDGSLSSDPDGDALTFAWDLGDGAMAEGASTTHTYTVPGLYTVCLTVNDGTVDSDPACTLAVLYDPTGGFVTGGGWIISPAGAYKADDTLTGKANFGFMSKYQKGSDVPIGNTSFKFEIAGLEFYSESYEWLVVNQNGTNAQFKGSGMINGALDSNGNAYKFMLWAGDGSPDTFRIRIWWEDTTGENVVYDNDIAQEIGNGNIVVHTGK